MSSLLQSNGETRVSDSGRESSRLGSFSIKGATYLSDIREVRPEHLVRGQSKGEEGTLIGIMLAMGVQAMQHCHHDLLHCFRTEVLTLS